MIIKKKIYYDEQGKKCYRKLRHRAEWDLVGFALVAFALATTVVHAIIYRIPLY